MEIKTAIAIITLTASAAGGVLLGASNARVTPVDARAACSAGSGSLIQTGGCFNPAREPGWYPLGGGGAGSMIAYGIKI